MSEIRKTRQLSRTLRLVLLASGLWYAAGASALAQGCSMCSTSLQGQSDSIVSAIQLGIVVMLLPPIAIVVAILLALRQRSEPVRPLPGSSPISQDAG